MSAFEFGEHRAKRAYMEGSAALDPPRPSTPVTSLPSMFTSPVLAAAVMAGELGFVPLNPVCVVCDCGPVPVEGRPEGTTGTVNL